MQKGLCETAFFPKFNKNHSFQNCQGWWTSGRPLSKLCFANHSSWKSISSVTASYRNGNRDSTQHEQRKESMSSAAIAVSGYLRMAMF